MLIYNEDLFNVLYKLNYKERLILLKSVTLSSLNDEKILNNGLTKYEAKEQLEKTVFTNWRITEMQIKELEEKLKIELNTVHKKF